MEIIIAVAGLAVGWLGRGASMYYKARKNQPLTFTEAVRLVVRGGRA